MNGEKKNLDYMLDVFITLKDLKGGPVVVSGRNHQSLNQSENFNLALYIKSTYVIFM